MPRLNRVLGRAAEAEKALIARGSASLADIVSDIGDAPSRVRYALRTLCIDGKAHIERFEKLPDKNGVMNLCAIYKPGPGVSMKLSDAVDSEDRLDFASTLHLQPYIDEWRRNQREQIVIMQFGANDAQVFPGQARLSA